MISYQDKTFCPFHADCKGAEKCGRALTDQVRADADKWWGEKGAPIMQYSDKPECHDLCAQKN